MKNIFILLVLLITPNLTAQWFLQNTGTYLTLYALDFIDNNRGWAVGEDLLIIGTTDSGTNWNIQHEPIGSNPFTDVDFVGKDTGWVIGSLTNPLGIYYHFVLKTTDGGAHWLEHFWGLYHFYTIKFINQNIGFKGGQNGLIEKSIDGGFSWTTKNDIGEHVTDIFFVDENIGWAVGYNGTIWKTSNSGETWILQLHGPYETLNCIYFIDRNIGWAAGGGLGTVFLKTTDGGDTWVYQSTGFNKIIYSVYFTDQNKGWAATYGGIYYTTNSGVSWGFQSSPYKYSLYDMAFIDKNIGWAVGSGGKILKTTTGGVVTIKDDFSTPVDFYLTQNYPNPFNPVTVINYSIPKLEHVKILVFDELGRIISTLVNELQPRGYYKTQFDAADLPSGVYYYQITAGDKMETKKMVLLR